MRNALGSEWASIPVRPAGGGNSFLLADDDVSTSVSEPPPLSSAPRAIAPWEESTMNHYMMRTTQELLADELSSRQRWAEKQHRTPSNNNNNNNNNNTGPATLSRGPFGELLICRGLDERHREDELRLCPCPPELAALNCEVDRLMAYCDVLRAEKARAVEQLNQQHTNTTEKMREEFLSEAHQRREEYTAATVRLQEENSTLRARVAVLESETNSRALEAEKASLQQKLGEVERSWSSLMKAKEEQWTQDAASLRDAKDRLESQHRQLRAVVAELESTLRRVAGEKEQLEHLLSEPQSAAAARELSQTRSDLTDAYKEMDALRRAADLQQHDAAQRERVFEEKTLELQKEIENERQRNNGVVAMYARQIESLEQQLTNAMSKNRMLVSELQKERKQHLQETLK